MTSNTKESSRKTDNMHEKPPPYLLCHPRGSFLIHALLSHMSLNEIRPIPRDVEKFPKTLAPPVDGDPLVSLGYCSGLFPGGRETRYKPSALISESCRLFLAKDRDRTKPTIVESYVFKVETFQKMKVNTFWLQTALPSYRK